jgi:hypothetical protein
MVTDAYNLRYLTFACESRVTRLYRDDKHTRTFFVLATSIPIAITCLKCFKNV